MAEQEKDALSRRKLLTRVGQGAGALAIGGLGYTLARAGLEKRPDLHDHAAWDSKKLVWQLDPAKCIQCGNCANYCVLEISAVKCMHNHKMCGYCELCTGYFVADPPKLDTGAENQLCPLGAINRTAKKPPYYEYEIDEDKCIGCGKCVKGCEEFGNGSLFMQVQHDRCLNCNECAIAVACPAEAFVRVPAETPYILKTRESMHE